MVKCEHCGYELEKEDLEAVICPNCLTELEDDVLASSMGAFYGETDFNLWVG